MAKIIAIILTLGGRGSDLKLDMLEAIDTIATDGKITNGLNMFPTWSRPSVKDAKKWDESSGSPPRGKPNFLGTDKVPHVEIQTILPERKFAGT